MKEHERLLYQENGRSQQMIMLYILCNTIITIVYTNNMFVNVQLGLEVALNIALSLFAFLMAVKQKSYAIAWGYAGIGLAVFQLARLLWMPAEITGSLRLLMIVLLIVSSAAALVGSIICIKISREKINYIHENNVDLSTLQQ